MANTLARMERDGLVLRRPDPEDGRIRRIWLTEKGRGLLDEATAAAAEENENVLSGLPAAERDQLVELLRKAINSREA